MSDEKDATGGSAPETSPPPTINITPLREGGFSRGLDVPMAAWVKGGTRTTAWDNEIKAREVDAEKRRNQQDADRAAASVPIEEGGAKMYSHHFAHPTDSPKVLIRFVNSKKETEYEMLCDVGVEHDGSSMWFIFVCPDCVARGIPSGQAQLRVSDKHRKWTLDDRTKGEMIRFDGQIYVSAGIIMDTETLRCPNNCTLAVKVHQNMMYRV